MKPLYVHYFDNEAAHLYNLTKAQYNKLVDEDQWDAIDKMEVEFDDFEQGNIPPEVRKLSEVFDFEVGTE